MRETLSEMLPVRIAMGEIQAYLPVSSDEGMAAGSGTSLGGLRDRARHPRQHFGWPRRAKRGRPITHEWIDPWTLLLPGQHRWPRWGPQVSHASSGWPLSSNIQWITHFVTNPKITNQNTIGSGICSVKAWTTIIYLCRHTAWALRPRWWPGVADDNRL